MKNSTLIFRSLAVIIFITGFAHLMSYTSYTEDINNTYSLPTENSLKKSTSSEKLNNNFLIGKWKAKYNTKDFSGAIIYNVKKEERYFNAYTYQYEDTNGFTDKADKEEVLKINLNGTNGTYSLTYNNKQYKVPCKIKVIDKKTIQISYDYYGYNGLETWKKQ